jgi:hypothetical protein
MCSTTTRRRERSLDPNERTRRVKSTQNELN